MKAFVRHFMRSPDELTVEDVKQYQLFLTRDKNVCWGTFNVNISAIRFFYREVLQVDWDIERIRYQKRGRKLPVVLSQEEICALLDVTTNLKHRAVLMTLYSAGLRISEALHLRPCHIDSARMMILIENAKGKKDRYLMLSEQLLVTLRRYWLEYRPEHWLFSGQDPSRPISRTAIDNVFTNSRKMVGIVKPASLHSLRHSFATHLLERGVNIRVIQRLLGHRSLRSTEIYTHVAKNYVRETKSPLDDLLPDVEAAERTLA